VVEPVYADGSSPAPATQPFRYDGRRLGGLGNPFGLAGNKYGWMVEIDPRRPDQPAVKHSWLGRFRHEAVAVRAVRGHPLIVYSGCDRHGGHLYRFVIDGVIENPLDPAIDPTSGDLLIAFTAGGGNEDGRADPTIFRGPEGQPTWPYGWIMRLSDGDPHGMAAAAGVADPFRWRMVATGGAPWEGGLGFSNPDNLTVDRSGAIWMVTDRSSSSTDLDLFGNNSCWVLPALGAPGRHRHGWWRQLQPLFKARHRCGVAAVPAGGRWRTIAGGGPVPGPPANFQLLALPR
jgi:secreted PhoX family phosphatase